MGKIKIDREFETHIEKRAIELAKTGEKTGTITYGKVAKLKLFLGEEPKKYIAVITSEAPELLGMKIYVGSNS